MSLEALIAASPSPQGAAKKRKGPQGVDVPDDETNVVKLLSKVTSIVLTEQRNQASRVGHCLLLPADHAMTTSLTAAKSAYANKQPPREKGKPGTGHPWGAPRNLNTAVFFEVTIKLYKGKPELVAEAEKIWGQDFLALLTEKVSKLVSACMTAQDFTPLDSLCQFFKYRVARSGQGIIELTGGAGKCFAPELRAHELFALPLEDLWGMLLMPYAEFITRGPAPQGRLERQLNKLIHK